MKRFALLVPIFISLFLSPAVSTSAEKDRQILFYLDENRLITLEFQITVEGQSFHQVWEEYLDQRFQEIDKNSDGQISGEERDQLPNTRLMVLMNPGQSIKQIPAPASLDRKAFGDHMAKIGFQPFQINIQPLPNQARQGGFVYSGMPNDPNQAAKRLFELLDRDSDGRLSPEEMEQALDSLRKQDLDQDETISTAELVPVNYNQFFVSSSGQSAQRVVENPFLSLGDRTSQREVASRLMAKYDTKEKDNALSRIELGVSETIFAEHDIDGNGKWDFEEIQQYLRSPTADVIVRIELGSPSKPGQPTLEFQHGEELTSEVKNAIGSLNLDAVQMEFSASPNRGGNLESLLKSQFQSLDQDNNGYLDKEEAQRLGTAQALFDLLDLDRDEKLFFEEFIAGVLPVAELQTRQIQLTVADRGRDLFRILDSNGDGRLSKRELWAMPHRAALWDKAGDGHITLSDVPQQYRLVAGRGSFSLFNRGGGVVVASPSGQPYRTPSTANSGPLWFQRMDRNNDGDVSAKEFLGPAEVFQKLDLNGDGLISPEEASQAEKTLKK